MNVTSQNVIAHELIGIDAKIVESRDPTLEKVSGKIVYETKNMLMLNVNNKMKMIPKKVVKLALELPDNSECLVNGSDLVGRPEDRIQRLM
ncbi:MAG: ribonuclease P protein subunit [Thaumarchaeota archaeon]|nr:ribonuclease P protein subunit [Nitrososphaerota archaeon]